MNFRTTSLFMEFISVLNSLSGVIFAFATKCKSLVHVPLSVWAWSLTIDVSDGSIFLLSIEISSTADWQGRLLAFCKLDQAIENDKCHNNDTDF